MQLRRIVLTALVAGLVANLYDYLVNGTLLMEFHRGLAVINPNPPLAWLVIGNFVAALVFVVVFARVRGSFPAGARGGAAFGLYAGILVNFPLWISLHLVMQGLPYTAAWVFTVVGVGWALIVGAVAGAVYERAFAAP